MRWDEAEDELQPLIEQVIREQAEECEEPELLASILADHIASWVYFNFGLEPTRRLDAAARGL